MKKFTQLLLATLIMSTTFALPAQAAINIGGPISYSGSVVRLSSYRFSDSGSVTQVTSNGSTHVIVPTQPSTTPSTSASVQTNINGSSVVSLKNILISYNQPTTPTQPSTSSSTLTPTQSNPTKPATTPTNPPSTPTTQPTSTNPPTSTTPTATNIPTVTALTPDEQSMVDSVNQERANAGLQPLKVDLRLASVARAKANDMLVNNYFDHTSPTYGSPWAMMQQVKINYKWAGENIAGNRSVAAAMAALMQSPGHRANILDPRFTHVGIGVATGGPYGNYFVQEFAQE